jgi:hypothetical protein
MPPLYNLIIGKQTLHDIGRVLDFKEKTITINEILLPMRNINNLQLKPSIFRALKQNNCLAPKPVSICNATKPPWIFWMLNMTEQTFQALLKTVVLTTSHYIATCYLHYSADSRSSLMAHLGIGSYRLSPSNKMRVQNCTMAGLTISQRSTRLLSQWILIAWYQ